MKKINNAHTFAKNTPILIRPNSTPATPGKDPSGINGSVQPPKNSVTITPEPAIIAAYSPRKNRANPMPEYSV